MLAYQGTTYIGIVSPSLSSFTHVGIVGTTFPFTACAQVISFSHYFKSVFTAVSIGLDLNFTIK